MQQYPLKHAKIAT